MVLGDGLFAQAVTGVMVAALALAIFTAGQTLFLYLQGWSPDRAIGRSVGRTVGVVSGMLTIGAMAFLQLGEFIDIVTQGIASAPMAATSIVTITLGAFGISTGRIGPVTFIVAAVTFTLFVRLLEEVRG